MSTLFAFLANRVVNMISSLAAVRFSAVDIVKKTFTVASILLAGSLALQQSAHASDVPNIRPALKKMLGGLAIDAKDDLQKMVADLKLSLIHI